MVMLSFSSIISNGGELVNGMLNTPWWVYVLVVLITVPSTLIFDKLFRMVTNKQPTEEEKLREYMGRNWTLTGGCLIDMDTDNGTVRAFFGNVLRVFSFYKIEKFNSLTDEQKEEVGEMYLELCCDKYKLNMTDMVNNIVADCNECCDLIMIK